MTFTKSDFEQLDKRIEGITLKNVEEIEINSEFPPTIEQLEDNNKTYAINAAILFIDIRKSTYLTEISQAKSMVKIYRSFMRMAVECVRKNGGVTRQFLGDRIMGVFIDSKDGDAIIKGVDKAINSARSLQTIIDYSLNQHLKANVNGKVIKCGIGIDYGKVLVTQVGMYGVENDPDKEDEVNCVWVGNTTNYASKYSDLSKGGEIFISHNVYKQITEKPDNVWFESAQYKGNKLFRGYIAKDYYLDFVESLGEPVSKSDEIEDNSFDTQVQLIEGIKEIERLHEKLINREKELVLVEDEFNKEKNELKEKCEVALSKTREVEEEKNTIIDALESIINEYFDYIKKLIDKTFCREYENIKLFTLEEWVEVENVYANLCKLKKYSEDSISLYGGFKFIDIYAYYKDYERAYKWMSHMAKYQTSWIYINDETFRWACKNNNGWKVIDAMEQNLEQNKVSYKDIKKYEGYIKELKDIRGF